MMAATFGLIISLWFAVMLIWSARRAARLRSVEQRLGLIEQDSGAGRVLRLWHDGHESTTVVPERSARQALFARLEKMRQDAAWETPLRSILLGLAGAMGGVFVLTLVLTGSVMIGVGAMLAIALLFWIYMKQRITSRVAKFERQLVDALELASRSLRAGHPLVGSFRLISDEIAAPVGTVFAEVCQQQGLGMSLDEAIRLAAANSQSADMKLFATSVIIQLRGGGNLADMMERLAFVIRERMRLARRVRVLTAQTQFSKRVLLSLPFLVFVLLNVINPQYMKPLYSTSGGHTLLMIAGGGLLAGAWMMNRLATIKA